VALTARPSRHRHLIAFVIGAAVPLLALAAWQWAALGSPLTPTYGSSQASFGLQYVLGQPLGNEGDLIDQHQSNLIAYLRALFVSDAALLAPWEGALGLLTLLGLARLDGTSGSLGRFGITAVVLTFLTYLAYFWQSPRFMLLPAILCTIGIAVTFERMLRWATRRITRSANQ
jgi:hypothetical protein